MRTHKKTKKALKGTAQRPRLSVFRSNSHIYGQLIDDVSGKTLVAADDKEIVSKGGKKEETSSDKKDLKTAIAKKTGELLAEKAILAKITTCVFDRRSYAFHGRVKALAEGAREKGLKF